ncbi:hypothetical protein ACWDRX_31260, partial [Streptomyces nigra]
MTGTGSLEGGEALLDRVFLNRVLEPGDETAGRWVREYGPATVVRRLRDDTEPPLPGVGPRRWEGLRARAERADPARDLAVARDAGMRFLSPGDAEWPRQLDDLGDARPLGLWHASSPTASPIPDSRPSRSDSRPISGAKAYMP